MGKCRPLSSDEAEAMKIHTHDLRDRALLLALERAAARILVKNSRMYRLGVLQNLTALLRLQLRDSYAIYIQSQTAS